MKTFKELREKSLPEEIEVDEALVASDSNILRAILNKIDDDVSSMLLKNQREKAFAIMSQIAKFAGYAVTKKKQAKHKTFLYKLRK